MRMTDITTTKEANKGFYPTPQALGEKLLDGIDWTKVETVLEPEAGKGDLVKCVMRRYFFRRDHYRDRKLNIDMVEIDPYLRSILGYEFGGQKRDALIERKQELEKRKKHDRDTYRDYWPSDKDRAECSAVSTEIDMLSKISAHTIHDDFLTYDGRKCYDLIIMNPPFADGDLHLLKAIELQKDSGAEIRCILNAETIANPYTNRRKLLAKKLEELGAKVSYEDGAFSGAERSTGVRVAMVTVPGFTVERKSTIFERLSKAAQVDDQAKIDVEDMTVTDFMASIVARFNVEVDAGIELIREYIAMMPYILRSFDKSDGSYHTLSIVVGSAERAYYEKYPSINEYIRLVRAKYWKALFSNKEFIGKLTTNLVEKYQKMVEQMADYDFTPFNIQQVALEMNAEIGKGVEDTIVELFDQMTAKHSWFPECTQNVHYFNGWATNQSHKIGKKVILPMNLYSSWRSDGAFDLSKAESVISDIEKVFDYLDGNMTADVDLYGVLKLAHSQGKTRNIDCKFFLVDMFKKGTLHIKFKRQDLVDRFNIYCCGKKGWLPPHYGKSTYSQMNDAEKAVVDSFHGDGTPGAGEKAYGEVMTRADYFLGEPKRDLPLLMSANK